jgi:amino acid adenylation domain-containing protein/non-ribosomal peptide synthase protein (TIGR01720 family)
LRVPPPQDAPPVEIIQRSLATTDPAEFDAALRDAHAAAVARLDHSAGRALVAVRFGGSGGYHGVLLVIHHFAVDGVSWRILAEDLARAYAQAVSGQPIDLGRKTTSFRCWSQSLADHVQERRGELPHWQSTTRPTAPLVTAGRLDHRRDRMETARYVERTLPPELTTRLLAQVPAAFRARINDVLLTALTLALARWREGTDDPVSGPLVVDLEGHGREPSDETQDLTRTVGWFTSLFPVRLDLGDLDLADAMAGGDQAGQALRSVKEQLRSVPHAGIGYGLLRHFDEEGRAALGTGTDPQIAFNYLGRFGSGQDGPFTPSRRHAAIIGGADPGMPLDHVVSLSCAAHETPAGPRLDAVWQFAPDLVAPHEMEALADLWMTALEALVRHCDRPGAGGPSPSDFDLITVDQAQIDAFVTLVPELDDVWPLTALQAGLLYHSQSARANDPYLVQVRLALAGRADPVRMQRALDALVSRHSILRVRLAYDCDARPVQLVPAAAELPLRHIELDDDDPRIADQFLRQDRERGFDMIGGPLIRAALIETPSQSSLLLTMHHLIVDGWSGAILLRELGTLYRHDGNGEMLPHPASFKPYLRWLTTRNAETARQAWEDYLRGADASNLFSADSQRGLPIEASPATCDLSAELTAQVERFASANGLTTASAVQGVWALLLALLSGRDDLSIGVVSAGRSADVAEAAQIVGMLACTTPVRATLRSGESVRAFLQRIQAGQAAMIPHRQLPLPEIRKIAGGPLFDTVFAFENYPLQGSGAGAPFAAMPGDSSSHYPLTLIAAPDSSLHLALRLGRPFGSETAAGLLARFERLLQEVVTDPDRDVARMDALLPGERGRLLELGEQPAPPLPPGTIVDLFEAQAARTPDNAAVTDGDRTISYSALDGQANRLAWKLIAAGVAPGTVVAIKLDRCAEAVVAILAVLKAGGAYLPIDPKLPPERCDDYLEQVQPRLILTTAGYAGTMAGRWRSRVVRMDAAETGAGIPGSPSRAPRRADRLAPLSPHHPAYLIFTSGSTGRPKAVVNTHRNLLYLYVATQARFAFDQGEVWTWFHSYAFDFSVWEIWGPLLRGGRLVVVSDAVARDPRALLDLLDREQVTTFSSTPSAFRRLLPLNPDGSGLALRKLVLGGEACPADIAGAWSLRCQVHNGYGPTETTVFATMSEELDGSTAPPIGTPLPGLRLYVLDHRLAPSAVGVGGDIYLAGPALAQGYHDRPGLTARRFVASPFVAGERMYRTGDRGAWRADQTLMFHGRDDRQVKLRGFRIELGEIEASLSALDGIDQALVRVMGEDGHSRLVAWLVAADGVAIDLGAVRQGLARRLPGFMIPGEWHVIATVPLNPNGKVAFDALPRGSGGLVRSYVAPTTPEEEALCAIAAAILGIDQVGLTDSFFDLGGDSLLAAQLSVQVSERLDRELPVATIFGHPVMAEMARRIGVVGNGAAAFAPLLTIRGQGALPPLFCLHPGTGLCWAYTNLLPILAPEQPLYGVQAQGFLPGSEPAASFGQVIDGCLSAIRSVRPHGPYHLAGWSFGGSVAHAVAARLRREGEEVARLLLFDAFPPEGATTAPASEPWTELAYGADLRAATAIHDAATLREAARAQGHVFGSFTTAQLEAMAVVMENNSRLLSAAKLDYFDGTVTLFEASRATPGLDRSIARPDAWRALCASLTVIPVDAEHHHMLSPTVVSQLRGEI